MEVLDEYLEDGTLVCVSGKQNLKIRILCGGQNFSGKECKQILNNDYKEQKLDIACYYNDAICSGVILLWKKKDIPKKTGRLLPDRMQVWRQ